MELTINGNTIILDGVPVAAIIDTDRNRSEQFKTVIAQLGALDAGKAIKHVLTIADNVEALAKILDATTVSPGLSAEEMLE